jgi:hypothetical protein
MEIFIVSHIACRLCAHASHISCYKYLERRFAVSGESVRLEFNNMQVRMRLKVIVAVTEYWDVTARGLVDVYGRFRG